MPVHAAGGSGMIVGGCLSLALLESAVVEVGVAPRERTGSNTIGRTSMLALDEIVCTAGSFVLTSLFVFAAELLIVQHIKNTSNKTTLRRR